LVQIPNYPSIHRFKITDLTEKFLVSKIFGGTSDFTFAEPTIA
jgi:hypothetical protein